MNDRLGQLTAAGVSVWLDDISRGRLRGGGQSRLRTLGHLRIEWHVVGVTTNPTIFAKALGESDDYAQQLRELAAQGVDVEAATRTITTDDVRWACDVMRPAYDATAGVDGRVSIEVDPRLAHDPDATVAQAQQLWRLVDRPNLFIKIPATAAGLPAITRTLSQGISVNVTLIFSLARYQQVIDAFMTGVEQARDAGKNLATLASVASFFVSRVDSEVDSRLAKLGSDEAHALRGQAAVANAQLAYHQYQQAIGTDRWQTLAAAGARPQRPLWASTSTKNAAYRDVLYVEELVAPGVVNTMPESTLEAFADHGMVRIDAVTGSLERARDVLDRLAALGVDYADVTATLEREGVEKFEQSWLELLSSVEIGLGAHT